MTQEPDQVMSISELSSTLRSPSQPCTSLSKMGVCRGKLVVTGAFVARRLTAGWIADMRNNVFIQEGLVMEDRD